MDDDELKSLRKRVPTREELLSEESREEVEEDMKKLRRRVKIENYVISTLLIAGVVGSTGYLVMKSVNYSRKQEPVELGFALPSKLELKIEDVNDNGKNEYFLQYDGKRYDIKLNQQGEPVLIPYTKPGE